MPKWHCRASSNDGEHVQWYVCRNWQPILDQFTLLFFLTSHTTRLLSVLTINYRHRWPVCLSVTFN